MSEILGRSYDPLGYSSSALSPRLTLPETIELLENALIAKTDELAEVRKGSGSKHEPTLSAAPTSAVAIPSKSEANADSSASIRGGAAGVAQHASLAPSAISLTEQCRLAKLPNVQIAAK